MAAIPINFTVYKGADFEITLNIKEYNNTFLDLSGYSLEAHMARNYTTSTKINLNPTVLNNPQGLIKLSIPKISTNFITGVDALKVGRYVFDIFLIAPNTTKDKIITGVIEVEPSVETPS